MDHQTREPHDWLYIDCALLEGRWNREDAEAEKMKVLMASARLLFFFKSAFELELHHVWLLLRYLWFTSAVIGPSINVWIVVYTVRLGCELGQVHPPMQPMMSATRPSSNYCGLLVLARILRGCCSPGIWQGDRVPQMEGRLGGGGGAGGTRAEFLLQFLMANLHRGWTGVA